MALDAAFVASAAKLCTGRTMSDAEAEDLGLVLESREEFLAYLLTRTDFLRHHPDVKEELLRVAAENGYEASTRRSALGPSAEAGRLTSALNAEIVKAVAQAKLPGPVSELEDLAYRVHRMACPSEANAGSSAERWIKP